MIAGTIATAVLLLVFVFVLATLLGAPYVTKNIPAPIVQSSYITALAVLASVLVVALTALVVVSAVMSS